MLDCLPSRSQAKYHLNSFPVSFFQDKLLSIAFEQTLVEVKFKNLIPDHVFILSFCIKLLSRREPCSDFMSLLNFSLATFTKF